MSQRKELDWQSQYEALSNARRVIRSHASVLLPQVHHFVLAAAPVIDSLRSIPARLAITVFQVGWGLGEHSFWTMACRLGRHCLPASRLPPLSSPCPPCLLVVCRS